MKAFARILYVLSLTAFCAACGGGGGSVDPNCRLNPDGSFTGGCGVEITVTPITLPGGIWEGIDSDGDSVLALVTETGRFHFIDDLGNQGSGTLSVSNGNDVTGNFQLVPELGFTFSDGTTLADCTLSGTVAQRQTLTVTVNCTTTAGLQDQTTATLNYNAVYERDSSLATIAGRYDDGSGVVTEIALDGTIFEQDPVSGCVTNGQVSVIIPAFNAYDVQFGFSNCIGQFAIFNGASFVGIATLDNTVTPELLFVGATGSVGGTLASVVLVAGRVSAPPPPPPPPVVPMSAAGIWVGEAVTPDAMDISTGFEFSDTNGFIMGTAPFTVDFQGGVTQTIGNAAFYKDGDFSWHISSAGASIVFGVPVESVTLWTRTTTNGDVATIQVLDDFGAQISSTAVTDNFVQIVEIPGMGAPLIGSVVITVAAGDEIVIDTFTSSFVSTASSDLINCLFAPAPRDDFVCAIADLGGNLVASANGTYSVNGDQVTGDGNLYAPPGETLANGSTVAPLTISAGTVVESTSLDLTISTSGLAIAVTSLFDDLYDRGADLATVAAVYSTFDIFGDMSSFTIDAGGLITGQSANGCVLNGQVSVIDAAANAYDVNLVVTDVGTCGTLVGDYDGLAASADEAAMNDQFVLTVFVDGVSFIVGNAVK